MKVWRLPLYAGVVLGAILFAIGSQADDVQYHT